MKLPWIARSTSDALLDGKDALIAELRVRLEKATNGTIPVAPYATVFGKHDVEGKLPDRAPGHLSVQAALAAQERRKIAQMIQAQAGTDRALAQHLWKYADQEAAKGETAETILQRIAHWGSADPDEDEVDEVPEPPDVGQGAEAMG